jgi:predicted XRE-type DNA-binding protein
MEQPRNWKPMKTIGPGVGEIRIRDGSGACRVIYVVKSKDTVHVLHCFKTTSKKTSRSDVAVATARYKDLIGGRVRFRQPRLQERLGRNPRRRSGGAERQKMLSDLSIAIERRIRQKGWTQKEAASQMGVTQPRVSNLLRQKLDLFSVDSLVAMAGAAGIRIELKFKPDP